MSDRWLPRIVAIGLIALVLATVASATALALNGLEHDNVLTLAGAAVGALAGFLTGVRINGTTET